ncbi:MAG: long-chain fatty acid--CoA ligase, partial [Acidobacteria bacterium]
MRELLEAAQRRRGHVALADGPAGVTYGELLDRLARSAAGLLALGGEPRTDLAGARVVFLVAPGADYARVQWAIWRAGGVAVPLSPSQPAAEWDYVIGDTAAEIVIGDAAHAGDLRAVAEARWARFTNAATLDADVRSLPDVEPSRPAMVLYTSGTTSLPKGVVITHANLEAQMRALIHAWAWTSADRVLHVLPLHHVHGIVNVLGCALRAGATCEFLSPFQPNRV